MYTWLLDICKEGYLLQSDCARMLRTFCNTCLYMYAFTPYVVSLVFNGNIRNLFTLQLCIWPFLINSDDIKGDKVMK